MFSLQFSYVQSLSCVRFFVTIDCCTPGFPVHHQLLELAPTHVHWVGDAIEPSHPLSSTSPAFSLSQHQGLFQWVSVFSCMCLYCCCGLCLPCRQVAFEGVTSMVMKPLADHSGHITEEGSMWDYKSWWGWSVWEGHNEDMMAGWPTEVGPKQSKVPHSSPVHGCTFCPSFQLWEPFSKALPQDSNVLWRCI